MKNELHVLTGSYALDALDGPELASFEHHLTRCPSCATEVRGLRETSARLAVAAARPAPARLREHVLAATYRVRQLPPLPGRRPRATWMPVVVAVAGAAAAVVLAVLLAVTSRQLGTAQAANRAVAAVLAAPDARIATAATSTGATMTIVASGAERQAVVTTAGMAPLPGGRVYQAWVIDAAGARSLGLLEPAAGDRAGPVLATGVRPGDRIGITVEPAGGTAQPTTTPLVTTPLPV